MSIMFEITLGMPTLLNLTQDTIYFNRPISIKIRKTKRLSGTIHSFTHLFNKYLLGIYYVPGLMMINAGEMGRIKKSQLQS